MRIAVLDPAAGISGDMVLGALVDCGLDAGWIRALPDRLGLSGVTVSVERVERAFQTATHVRFDIPDPHGSAGGHDVHHTHHHGHHVPEIVGRIRSAGFSPWVTDRAVRAFELLGEAEGRVHGVSPDRVHLHEVGAADALLDVVGAVSGFEHLGVEAIHNLPVACGRGWVAAAHGRLPVPAPATSLLLSGVELATGGPVEGEATTPTGAALIRALSEGPPPPAWRIESVGWGAGTRNPESYANVLRLFLGETAAEAAVVEVIATDIDDMTPEYLESVRSAIFSAGAVDCVIWPTGGKKGRVSLRLEAQVPAACIDAVQEAIFRHTTTAGIRRWTAFRRTLPRREMVVEVAPSHPVRVKIVTGSGYVRTKPESDDVIRVAEALGRSAQEVAAEAKLLADRNLARGGRPTEETE